MIEAVLVGANSSFTATFEEKFLNACRGYGWEIELDVVSEPKKILESDKVYDIYFFDVVLPGMSGVALAQMLRDSHVKSEFVFTGRDEQYIRKTMRVVPRAFIRTDYIEEDLEETVRVLNRLWMKRQITLSGTNCCRQIITRLEDILYIQSQEHYVNICYLNGERKILRNKLSSIEQQLEPWDFLRIHRRLLINMRYVEKYEEGRLCLKGGEWLGISGTYKEKVEKELQKMYFFE